MQFFSCGVMSLSDYDFLPKVTEKTPLSFEPEKSDQTNSIELEITNEKQNESERGSLTGSSFLKDTDQLITIDPATGLASSETIVSGILKKAASILFVVVSKIEKHLKILN